MLKQLENKIMLHAIAQGDERAFQWVFNEYHQSLGSFVFSITRSKELTEEIIQDVFLKLWEDRKALPDLKNFAAYLFIITRNHTLNSIRKHTLLQKKQQGFQLAAETLEEPAHEENYYTLLDKAVDQLPLQQKKVYLLRQQGLKNNDIAFQMNISVNSVKKYQQWAMQAITKLIKAGPFTPVILLIEKFF